MRNTIWVNMRLNAILGLALCIFTMLGFINHNLEKISEQIHANSQAKHNITTEYVILNPGEPWDVREVGR